MAFTAKKARKRLGLTQLEFARLMGVSVPTVQRWEYGKTEPSLLQADILNQIESRIACIEREEKRTQVHIGDLLREVLIAHGMAYGLYKLLEILFNNNLD